MKKRCIMIVGCVLMNLSVWTLAQEIPLEKDSVELEQIDFANGLFGRGLFDMAKNEYEKYQTTYPQGTYLEEARFGMAESLFFNEGYDEAILLYITFIKDYPQSERLAMVQLRLGQAKFQTDKVDEALTVLASVNRKALNPAMQQALDYFLGRSYYKKEDYTNALKSLKTATSHADQQQYLSQSYLLMGDIHLKQNNLDASREVYNKAETVGNDQEIQALALFKKAELDFDKGKYKEAAKTFITLMEKYKELGLAKKSFVNLLSSHYNLGEHEKVVAVFTERQSTDVTFVQNYQVYQIVANAYIQMAKYDEAIAILDQGLALDVLTPEEQSQLTLKKAEGLMKAKRMEEAHALMANAETTADQSEKGLFLQAESLFGLGKYKEAIVAYQKVVTQFPESELRDEAQWSIALAQKQDQNNVEALKSFANYYKEGKDDINRAGALYNMILIETNEKKLEQAVKHTEEYLKTFQNGEHYDNLLFLKGVLYQDQGKQVEAIQAFQAYATSGEDTARLMEVQFLSGYNHQLAGKAEEALKSYAKVLETKEANNFYYSALKNSAVIHLSKKQNAEALRMFERLNKEFPENDLTVDTYIWMAEQYLEQKKYAEVNAIFEFVQEDTLEGDKGARVAYTKAEAFKGLKQYDQAREQYDVVVFLQDKTELSIAAQVGKAHMYKEQGDFESATKEYEAIIESNANNHTILIRSRFALAEIAEAKKDLENATKLYMLVAVLYEDIEYSPEALFKAGGLLEQQGKKDKALSAYDEIVEKYPESPFFQPTLDKIHLIREE